MSADPLDKQLVEAVLSRPRRAKADLEEAKMAGLRPSRPKAGVVVAGDDDDEDDDGEAGLDEAAHAPVLARARRREAEAEQQDGEGEHHVEAA